MPCGELRQNDIVWLKGARCGRINVTTWITRSGCTTADRTYQKLVRHLVGLRGVCGHLRGCRAVAIIFPQLNVGLVGPESTFERIGPPTRHFDGGRRENAVAANRPLLLITSGLRSRRDSADLSLSQKYTAPVQWSATVDRGLEAWRRAPAYHCGLHR
jgi:hypothetical protein